MLLSGCSLQSLLSFVLKVIENQSQIPFPIYALFVFKFLILKELKILSWDKVDKVGKLGICREKRK